MTLLPLELMLVVTWSTIVTWCWCLFDGCDCCWTFPFPASTCALVLKAGGGAGAGAADIEPFSAASASLAAATMGSAAEALTCMFVILLAARAAVAAVPVLGRTWLSQYMNSRACWNIYKSVIP